ncbi:MAG: tail fiber domain-containing protein [Saprospiraceae bacterium]|nr:tail fiber domain-containing protein [Saprospiraceae bacterium]
MKSVSYSFRSLKLSLTVFFSLGMALVAQAQVATLSVQGVLTKSDGTAVDDGNDYVLTFRLWKSESSTAPADKVHQETIENISIVGGVYSVVLGLNPDPQLQLTAPFNQPYWLGVSVGTSSVELLPRPRLTHAPYALGLVGQNNIFPSTGAVIGDAFRAKGGPATGGQGPTANGYSFHTIGDDAGGMYSEGGNNIELWAGGAKKVKLSSGLNELYGQTNTNSLSVFGDHTVNGNQQINGASTITNGQTVSNGQTVNGGNTINGNSYTSGNITSDSRILTDFIQGGGGFSFKDDTGFDTGMFSSADGSFGFLCNAQNVLTANTSLVRIEKDFYLTSAPNMTDGDNLEWRSNVQGGRVGVNTSSRRYKYNIQPLQVDFTRMLKVQPRIYNRISEGDDKWEIGYIAEEIDSLGMKDLVLYDEQGRPNSLIYKKFIIYTNELVKMQHNEIELLKAQVNTLNKELQQLQAANASLQGKNNTLLEQQTAFSAQLEALSKRISAMEISGTGK